MSDDKLKRLLKYKEDVEQKLSSPIPPKHVQHPDTYKQFLRNELATTESSINKLKGLV